MSANAIRQKNLGYAFLLTCVARCIDSISWRNEDRIKRAAQFMAHAGEELGLGEVGFFRHRPGVLELDVLFLQHLIQRLRS